MNVKQLAVIFVLLVSSWTLFVAAYGVQSDIIGNEEVMMSGEVTDVDINTPTIESPSRYPSTYSVDVSFEYTDLEGETQTETYTRFFRSYSDDYAERFSKQIAKDEVDTVYYNPATDEVSTSNPDTPLYVLLSMISASLFTLTLYKFLNIKGLLGN